MMEQLKKRRNLTGARRSGMRILFFLAGLALGLLFAPNSGRANRTWVRQRIDGWRAGMQRRRRDLIGQTDYEIGRATGIAHNLGRRMGLIKKEVDLSDDVVNQRVRTELGESSAAWQIPRLNIDTFDGVVTLRGHVNNEHQCRAIEDVVRKVRGVREIVNKLSFGPVAAQK